MSSNYSPAELVQKWEDLLQRRERIPEIHALTDAWPDKRSLWVPFAEVDHHDPDLAAYLLEHPQATLAAGEEAIVRSAPAGDVPIRVHLRVDGLPEDAYVGIDRIRMEHVGRLVRIDGIVQSVGAPKGKIVDATFQCLRCQHVVKLPQEGTQLREPLECYQDQGGCGRTAAGTKFKMIGDASAGVDVQTVELRDLPEALKGHEVRLLRVVLEDDLVGTVPRDARVSIAGILRTASSEGRGKGAGRTSVMEFFLDAVSVQELEDADTVRARGEAATMDRADALGRIEKILGVKDPRDRLTILLCAAQDHIVSLLESVFYLAFRGKTGSGKGTGVEAAILLTRDGQVLSSSTEAYLASVLDEGRAIGIEEADKLVHKNPSVEALLRNGYRRGAVQGFMIPVEGEKWAKAERSVFGVKIYDFHTSIDAHLLGRTVVIELEPDPSVDRAMDAEKKASHLRPVRLWLAAEAERALQAWTKDRVRALWDDPAFRKRVGAMGGTAGRDHIIAANLLLICEVFGWDYAADIAAILGKRKTIDEYGDEAEVLDVLTRLHDEQKAGRVEEPEVLVEAVLQQINDNRARLKLRSMTPQRLGGVLRDLDFKKGNDWEKLTSGPDRNKWVLHPRRALYELERLEQLEQTAAETPHSIWSGAVSDPDAPAAPDAPANLGGVDQRGQFLALRAAIEELGGTELGDGAVHTDILELAEHRGIPRDRAEAWLRKWKQEGEVYCPTSGRFKLTRGGSP